LERIARFIRLLGWDRVRRAAEYTAARQASKDIADPWYYVVGVINHNSARASYLFTLIHWIELGLRAGVDCALSDRYGANWHLVDPPVYLDLRSLGTLWSNYLEDQRRRAGRGFTMADDRPRVQWRQDVVTQTYIPAYESPESFLAALDFEPLTQVVLHAYEARDPRIEPILFSADGGQMPLQTAKEELRWLRKFVRNIVAHNHPPELAGLGDSVFDLNEYIATATRTEKILAALRYDAAPALARHELKRLAVVDEAVRRHGAESLKKVFGQVERGSVGSL
jgi:hypothetical protein